ncbi:hypothetical protein VaNZ11_008618 [Volvox africanus]|uniref:Uncharacterized protein n=1 Tax=Volvox africanus TaxID=51714 RepID=A0ABQ5S5I1_9CHLO|nr:hypothetical protein VaNZ11_008618 [Volvox africanus]
MSVAKDDETTVARAAADDGEYCKLTLYSDTAAATAAASTSSASASVPLDDAVSTRRRPAEALPVLLPEAADAIAFGPALSLTATFMPEPLEENAGIAIADTKTPLSPAAR